MRVRVRVRARVRARVRVRVRVCVRVGCVCGGWGYRKQDLNSYLQHLGTAG